MAKVNVYASEFGDGEVVARVNHNRRLDRWDGSNWSSGYLGMHLGITRLRSGEYVLIHISDWSGEHDWAETVSDERALQAILKSGNTDLLDEAMFRPLQALAESLLQAEAV